MLYGYSKLLRKKLYFLTSAVILSVFAVIFILSVYLIFPLSITKDYYIFEIKKGDSLYKVANKLSNDNIISYPKLLRIFMYTFNIDSNIQVGEYEFARGSRIYDLVYKITTGDIKHYKITILETETLSSVLDKISTTSKLAQDVDKENLINQIAKSVELTEDSKQYVNKQTDNLIFSKDSLGGLRSIEGLLYADTYYFTKDTPASQIFTQAFNKFNLYMSSSWKSRDKYIDNFINSPYEAIVIASIIEREASSDLERKLIAGVIYNRLAKKMPLQMDPTVIYALGDGYSGNLTKADLSTESDYNTYVNRGLPPTPIGFVSESALDAALNPIVHNYIYFVAMGNGKHFFSVTLQEHNNAVKKYQLKDSADQISNKIKPKVD